MQEANDGRRWCVVQTKPMEAEIAVAHLRRQGFEVFMPLLRERRRKDVKIVPMFPGYLFVAIDPSQPWQPIGSTRGVKRLITAAPERPAYLPGGWVESLKAQGIIDTFLDALTLAKGDRVEFIAGPFEGRFGTCQWTSELRIRILFEFMGREISVACDPKILRRAPETAPA